MKKAYYFIVALILFILPISVKAEVADGLIELTKNLTGDEIENHKFKFILKDLEGNIIQEKENIGNKIIFEPIKYTDSDIGKTFYYIATEKNETQPGIEYDESSIYISVKVGEEKTNTYYVNPNWYSQKKEPSQPFHASEEDLQGEAYAVFDPNTKTLTFFREEENIYEDGEVKDGKIYYANIEAEHYGADWVYKNVEKIVFKDAIKPKEITSWFKYMHELKEIDMKKLDTSLVTSLRDLFYDCPNLRQVDISTMDVSNVTDLARALEKVE